MPDTKTTPDNARLIMLGTGSAFPSQSFNTCYVLQTPQLSLMVDTGGGREILEQMKRSGIDIADVSHLLLTHAHTDHILGAVWLVRVLINRAREGRALPRITVYGNTATLDALTTICRLTLLESHYAMLPQVIELVNVGHGTEVELGDTHIRFIDCRSTGVDQTGFRATLPSGHVIVGLGDESLGPVNSYLAEDADTLVCGAFCRYADRDIFHPYEKHHLTVADVAKSASDAGVGTLILVHCEDRRLPEREKLYTAEAAPIFSGRLLVPSDGAVIDI